MSEQRLPHQALPPRSLPPQAVFRFARAVIVRELDRLHSEGLAADHHGADLDRQSCDLELDSLQALGVFGALSEALTVEDLGPCADNAQSMADWIACAAAQPIAQLTIATSGSTGTPKLHRHSVEHLLEEARWFAARLPDIRRVIALVPADHLYGLIWTAILPAILDVPVVQAKVSALPPAQENDLIVAVPEQWAALARIARTWPPGTVGVSSAGRLDDKTASAVLDRGLSRLIDIYGASECGGIAMREAPHGQHSLLSYWSVEEDQGSQLLVGRGKRIELPDRIETAPDGSLVLKGRRDRAVSIGGINVYPERIAERLQSVEGVAEAAVRLGTNGRLKACIVPARDTDEDILRSRIGDFAKRSLRTAERLSDISFAPALPRNAMGKLSDW